MIFRTHNNIKYFLHPGKANWYDFKTGKIASLEISNILFKLI